jgi:DNA-binding response OmpR family regulator
MMNATPVKVLIVDTDERSYLRMEQLLGAINRPYEVAWAATFDAGRRAIDERWFDVALVDGLLGERNGLDLIYYARDNGCPTPLVLLRGESDEELDAHAMRAGAADCLLREWIDARVLDRAIRCSIERFRVTEQRNAEYAFHESQHVFRTFMDNSPAVSFI